MPQAGREPCQGVRARTAHAVGRFDEGAERLFALARGHRHIDRVMYAASALEEVGMWALTVAALQGLGDKRWQPAVRTGAAVGVESLLINTVVKSVFRRGRPVPSAPRPYPLRKPLTSSFPSAHAASAFCCATLLADGDPRLAPFYYAGATVVAVSRIYVQVHHASDVVGGMLIGLIWGHLCRRLVPLEPRGGASRAPAQAPAL